LGKVLIIKALIIPIFTFIVSSCVIPEKYKKEIESKCFKFIWNGKPDKIKSMFILKISHIFPNTFKYFSGISFQFENFESANLLTHDAFKDIK
jgi:hypothetical protein